MADERSEGVVALSRWRAVLARSRNPRKRLEMVLADPQASALVGGIPTEELYYLVRGVGLTDALEVLRLASPEQIQGFLDLDLWERDRLAPTRVFAWMEVLAELPPSVLARAVRGLDPELIALVLGRHARIYDRSVGEAPDDESPFIVKATPDATFIVEMRTSNATAARTLERFIDRLYNADPDLARVLLNEAKWGMTAELEEDSYRWRTARLADMGFPAYEDAVVVYREVDADRVLAAAGVSPSRHEGDVRMLPVPFAESLGGDSLFERALAELDDATLLGALSAAIIALLNRVLVADHVEPADLERVRETTARVRDTLSLGLERLSGGDVREAALLLARVEVDEIFGVGWSITAAVGRRARELERQAIVDPDLDAMLTPRPLFPRGLDPDPEAGERPFRTLADVRTAEAYLTDLASRFPD